VKEISWVESQLVPPKSFEIMETKSKYITYCSKKWKNFRILLTEKRNGIGNVWQETESCSRVHREYRIHAYETKKKRTQCLLMIEKLPISCCTVK
jgi:hypothetical protein